MFIQDWISTTLPNSQELETTTDIDYDYYDYGIVDEDELVFRKTVDAAFTVAAHLSTVTLIYGIATWAMISKSRTFQNYVYINVILAVTLDLNTMYLIGIEVPFLEHPLWLYGVFMFSTAFHCWLFVATVLIYRNIVVVFNSGLPRKYLISNAFAWGVPIFWIIAFSVLSSDSFKQCYKVFTLIMLIVEMLIYVSVLYNLFKGFSVRSESSKWRNVQVATVVFFMGGAPMLLAAKVSEPLQSAVANHSMGLILILLVFIIDLLYLTLKTNRDLWCKLIFKRNEKQ